MIVTAMKIDKRKIKTNAMDTITKTYMKCRKEIKRFFANINIELLKTINILIIEITFKSQKCFVPISKLDVFRDSNKIGSFKTMLQ